MMYINLFASVYGPYIMYITTTASSQFSLNNHRELWPLLSVGMMSAGDLGAGFRKCE